MRPVLCLAALALAACDRAPTNESASLPPGALELRDVGFQSPESVLYDSVADVYLVSNINGGGRDRDDNGFISRVSPEGELLELKWIDGADSALTLNAPKGTAIIGDSLFIADLDSIRVFDRNTGAAIRAFTVSNATALNDLAVASDGALWVTDMGRSEPEHAGSTGLHRVAADGSSRMIVSGAHIEGPNGVVSHGDDVAVAAFRGNAIRSVTAAEGLGDPIAQLDGSQLDGLVRLPDGTLLVSSWEARTIFRIAPDGTTSVLQDNLQSPADIGFDSRRNRVLVPSFEGNWLRMYPVQ